jgi:ectoine hydroxylase-related dioxygenase (phytanoyl-CoA dioxygenase family)
MTAPTAPYIARVEPFIDSADVLDDHAAIQRRAAADGYLFFRNLAPRDLVEQLRGQVLDQCARRGWLDGHTLPTRDELLAWQADVQVLPAFSALRGERRITSVLEMIFGVPAVAGCGDVCRVAFPRDLERTTRPHQDHFYTRGSTSLWTVWIPLGDCPALLGGLAVLPGSHTDGLRAHDGGEGESRYILLPEDVPWAGTDFRAGDVLMVNALTVHGARPNMTEQDVRVSIDCRYRPRPHHA